MTSTSKRRRKLTSLKRKTYNLTDLPKTHEEKKRINLNLQVQIDEKGHNNKDQILEKVEEGQKKILSEVLDQNVEAQTKIRELYDKCVKRDKEYAELYFEDKVKSKLENRK